MIRPMMDRVVVMPAATGPHTAWHRKPRRRKDMMGICAAEHEATVNTRNTCDQQSRFKGDMWAPTTRELDLTHAILCSGTIAR
jgi:hypothetical protein